MRKILGLAVAALALVCGGFASRAVDSSRERAVRSETARAAEGIRQRAADSLSALVSDLRLKVENAAANPRLVFALQGNADERTIRDLWRTEDWWRPWRTEFKIYAVAVKGVRLDVVEGIDAADLDADSLLRRARDRGDAAAEIIIGKGWPYAAAATTVRVSGRDKAPVLLLARPVDQVVMRQLVDKTGGAVTLTNGHAVLVDAGSESERAVLSQAIGSEATGTIFYAKDGAWAAALTPVAPALWLWTFVSTANAIRDAQGAASERMAMVWGVVIVVAGAAVVFGLRRPREQAPTSAQFPSPGAMTDGARSTSWTGANVRAKMGTSISHAIDGGTSPGPSGDGTVDPRGPTAVASSPVGSGGIAPESPFGRYTLLDRLGEGGMAEVYTAVTFGAQGFRRKFVIKRLRAEMAREPAAVDQFIDEANLASSMVHSNIVPVFDFGKVGEEYFMAQEYILGRDLTRVTRRSMERDGRPLPSEVALYAAHETLKALEYAHSRTNEQGQPLGIVHRDVSPSNVIISARGEVKLFDFGIVKAEGRVTKTQSGVVKGNVTFMAPEQARGVNVDARADLFSLGLVVFYCLTGQVLYAGNTTYELLVKAATGPDRDEFNQIRALPEPCGDILQRALQPKPDDRFQTARQFADAIAAHLGAGAARLAALMHHLFDEDFKIEETRFRSFGPLDPSGTSGPGSGSHQTEPRQS